MYIVHDLQMNKKYRFMTERNLTAWWKRQFPLPESRFSELNMTGKDTYTYVEFRYRVGELPVPETTSYLRRYRVTDEDGRSVDIRNWASDLWTHMPAPRTYSFPPYKRTGHRLHGPSMYRNTIRQAQAMPEIEGVRPIVDRSAVRNKSLMSIDDNMDYYDRRHGHGYYADRSWKSQTKARKQYAKHKTHHKEPMPKDRDIFKALAEDGFTVSAAAMAG